MPNSAKYCTKNIPVSERANKGVGQQLNSGLGGKQHSHFDVLIQKKTGRLGAVAGIRLQLCRSAGCCGRPSCGVGGERPHAVVVQGHDAVKFVLRTLLMRGVVLQHCGLIQAVQVAGNDGDWQAEETEGDYCH